MGGVRDWRIHVGERVPDMVDPDLAPATYVLGKLGVGVRVLKHHPLDQMRHGVELVRGDLTTQPGSLERDRSSARKQVDHFGWLASVRGEHFLSRLLNHRLWTTPAAERVEEVHQFGGIAMVSVPWHQRS